MMQMEPHRRNRMLLVALAVVVVGGLLVQAGDALAPFAIALVLGYFLAPLVDRLSRVLPRAAAALLVLLLGLGLLIGAGFLVVPASIRQIRELLGHWPDYARAVQALANDGQAGLDALNLPAGLRDSLDQAVQNAIAGLGSAAQGALVSTLQLATRTLVGVFSLLIIPFWLFFVLKDKDLATARFYAALPATARADAQQVLSIAGHVLNSYIRGQVFLGGVVGLATTVGLFVVGAPYWLLLGALYGVGEVVPIVGPILGAVPGVLLALLSGDWSLVLKVLVVYILVQQLENNLLVPKIQGDQVRMHPALIILAIVVGSQVAGLWGVLLAVPLAAIGRDLYRYVYRRWGIGESPACAGEGLVRRVARSGRRNVHAS